MTDSSFEQIFPLGETNDALDDYFIGQSYLAPLTGGSTPVNNVTFEPGCRNNWHIHHGTAGGGDQILLCTAGSGWYQAEREEPVSMEPGTSIRIPAGIKHWHGAKADSWFSHLAFITPARTSTTNGSNRSSTRSTGGCRAAGRTPEAPKEVVPGGHPLTVDPRRQRRLAADR